LRELVCRQWSPTFISEEWSDDEGWPRSRTYYYQFSITRGDAGKSTRRSVIFVVFFFMFSSWVCIQPSWWIKLLMNSPHTVQLVHWTVASVAVTRD